MAEIIQFPTKAWKRKIEQALKHRFGPEEAPEELLVYLESLIDDTISEPLKYTFSVSIYGDRQHDEDAINDAVNELVQNLQNQFMEKFVAPLFKKVVELRLRVYELEHEL